MKFFLVLTLAPLGHLPAEWLAAAVVQVLHAGWLEAAGVLVLLHLALLEHLLGCLLAAPLFYVLFHPVGRDFPLCSPGG